MLVISAWCNASPERWPPGREAGPVADAIAKPIHTGTIGYGKIWVCQWTACVGADGPRSAGHNAYSRSNSYA